MKRFLVLNREEIERLNDLNSAGGWAVYAYLKRLVRRDNRCCVKQADLTGKIGVTVRSIKRNIKDLKDAGLIGVKRIKGVNCYDFPLERGDFSNQPTIYTENNRYEKRIFHR